MSVVFDAEPLIAFALDEEGADVVEEHLDRVYDDEEEGFVSAVNLAELRYVSMRLIPDSEADKNIQDILDMGLTIVDATDVWEQASDYKNKHNVAIGDAFALGSAEYVGATLLVGADDDYDDISEVSLKRFRTEPA